MTKSKRSLTEADVALARDALPGGSRPGRAVEGQLIRAGDLSQEDPRIGGEGQRTRVPPARAVMPHSGDDADVGEAVIPLSHYKGTSLKNIGRDKNGRVIPHKRSEKTAVKVRMWAAGGYSENDIAIMLNIRPGLVRECYGKELNHGKDMVGMDLTAHAYKRAKQNDNMLRFVLKARHDWRDGESRPTEVGLLNIHIHT